MIITGVAVPDDLTLPLDVLDVEHVGVQISEDRKKVWVCVNGVCILRVSQRKKGYVIDFDTPPF
jgi:hypothetical protein